MLQCNVLLCRGNANILYTVFTQTGSTSVQHAMMMHCTFCDPGIDSKATDCPGIDSKAEDSRILHLLHHFLESTTKRHSIFVYRDPIQWCVVYPGYNLPILYKQPIKNYFLDRNKS